MTTAVPEYRTVRSGLFIGLHFELETGPFFPRPDCIFRSGLRSQLTRPYGPVFFTVSKKGSGLGPDRTVASLVMSREQWFMSGRFWAREKSQLWLISLVTTGC